MLTQKIRYVTPPDRFGESMWYRDRVTLLAVMVRDTRIGGNALRLWAELALNHTDIDPFCYVYVDDFAKLYGVKRNSIIRWLGELKRVKAISCEREGHVRWVTLATKAEVVEDAPQ